MNAATGAEELLSRLARIPDAARTFSTSMTDAVRYQRLPSDLLDSLMAVGLRYQETPDGPLFDRTDLRNVSMHLGVGSAAMAARRFWAAGLNPPPGTADRPCAIYYQPRCPAPGHAGDCRFRLATPHGVVERTARQGHRGTVLETKVSLTTEWPALPAAMAEVLEVVAGFDFMFLPRPVRNDPDFTRRTGMCDCEGSARLIVTEAARRGVPARSRFGLIVTPPYSTVHNWVEFPVEDRWVPVDPVLIDSMVRWGMLDRATWHRRRSIGPVVVALGERRIPLVTHDGSEKPVPLTLSTRRLTQTGS